MFWAARALHCSIQRVYNLAWKDGVISNVRRDGGRLLQLIFSEEFLASASRQLVLITSQPFENTARHSHRLSDSAISNYVTVTVTTFDFSKELDNNIITETETDLIPK